MLVSERRAYPRGGGRRALRAEFPGSPSGPTSRRHLRRAGGAARGPRGPGARGLRGPWRPTSTRRRRCADRQRTAYAELAADPADVATTRTKPGVVRPARPAPRARRRGPHRARRAPGLLGPLATLCHRTGVTVRTAPSASWPAPSDPGPGSSPARTWVTGAIRPEALAAPDGVPVLDGAQGVGAIGGRRGDARLRLLRGCRASGSGPIGTGLLLARAEWRERLEPLGATFGNLAEPSRGLDSPLQPDARRRRPGALPRASAAAVAAHEVLAAAGWDAVHERARSLAAVLADRLRGRGCAVAPRGDDARRLGGPRPARPARPPAQRASSSATSRAPVTCAPRWAPGTTRATSSACSPA